jgi:hypothetical protein
MMLSPYDVVVLVKDMPDKGLTKGMVGTVIAHFWVTSAARIPYLPEQHAQIDFLQIGQLLILMQL